MLAPPPDRRIERLRRKRLGQFFTPYDVAVFAAEVLVALDALPLPRAGPVRVVDPAAGEGVFLRALLGAWPDHRLCGLGLDIDESLRFRWLRETTLRSPRAQVRLVHGHGLLDHAESDVVAGSFDFAVGNPPYGGEGLAELKALAEADDPTASRWSTAWNVARAVLGHSELWRRSGQPVPELGESPPARLKPGLARLLEKAARFPIEILFVERFVSLVRPGGWIAAVLPEGLLANARTRFARDWLAEQGTVAAVVGLPRLFAGAGASARTSVVFFRKALSSSPSPADGGPSSLVVGPEMEWRPLDLATTRPRLVAANPREQSVSSYLETVKQAVRGPSEVGSRVPWERFRRERWDPQFWDPRCTSALEALDNLQSAPLGDYIRSITYGPIVTRLSPAQFPGEVAIINQAQFEESGIDLGAAVRVARDSVFDPERSRPRPRDLLFPRSGAGTLGRNRLAVLDDDAAESLNVGCFVNVIRLEGINPYYAWLFLKTRLGWGQVKRIINGVGMPNISFDEIKALRIPVVGRALQEEIEARWRADVKPRHRELLAGPGGSRPEAGVRAHAAMLALVGWLEEALAGARG